MIVERTKNKAEISLAQTHEFNVLGQVHVDRLAFSQQMAYFALRVQVFPSSPPRLTFSEFWGQSLGLLSPKLGRLNEPFNIPFGWHLEVCAGAFKMHFNLHPSAEILKKIEINFKDLFRLMTQK